MLQLPIQATPTQRAVSAAPVEPVGQYLTFVLHHEIFAIGILAIKEIIEFGQVTSVPMMPDFIRGVINLRGSVVPVIDLASRFGQGESSPGRRTCIVIIEICHDDACQDIGIMVDAVNEVLEIDAAQIEPPPSFGTQIKTAFISGMGRMNNRFIIILNLAQVLSIEEMSALAGVAESPLAAAA